MRINKYGESEYCMMSHNRIKMYYTLVEDCEGKKAKSVSIPHLTFTKFESTTLGEKMARTYGEMLIRLADELKTN